MMIRKAWKFFIGHVGASGSRPNKRAGFDALFTAVRRTKQAVNAQAERSSGPGVAESTCCCGGKRGGANPLFKVCGSSGQSHSPRTYTKASRRAQLPQNMNRYAQFEILPVLIGGIDGCA